MGDDALNESGRSLPWWTGPAAIAGAWLLELLGRTWRIEWRRDPAASDRAPGDGRSIYAFWHARMLALGFAHRRRGVAILVSRSRDGELIARVIERLGFVTARGSSTRGGGEGALEMLAWAERGRDLALTPDGPRGPALKVKPGLAWLASRTGRPVVPAAAAASRSWVLRSWDAFRVPKPFARVCVAYGAPVPVPAGLDPAAAERWAAELERGLEVVTRLTATAVGEER